MNNKYHPKTISEIIILKVVAATMEAFVLHKILFCDRRKLIGRSRSSPDTSVLPHSRAKSWSWISPIYTYTTQGVICFFNSFRIPSFELFTFSPTIFKREWLHESSGPPLPPLLPFQEVSLFQGLTAFVLSSLSCPVFT